MEPAGTARLTLTTRKSHELMTTESIKPANPLSGDARRPAVAVLVVIFTVVDGALQVLLIERSAPPAEDQWAIPGGALQHGESLDQAAVRKLAEETGVTDLFLEQLYTFADLDPSSTDGSVGVSYFALVDQGRARLAQRTAWRPDWWSLDAIPPLAFDNEQVIDVARQRLINKLQYTDAAYSLLPPQFTMRELQEVYEAILGRPLDKRNFRRRLLATDFIKATSEMRSEGRHRPARLYQFTTRS